MPKFSFLRDVFDFSFKSRRLILLSIVGTSAIGMSYWHIPAIARLSFLFAYTFLLAMGVMSQTGYFTQFARTAIGMIVFGRKYKSVPLASPEIETLASKMGVSGKVRVYSSTNPWVLGPFTNAVTSRVYVPVKWLTSFPMSETISVVGHEFGHIKRRKRFFLELSLAFALSYGTFLALLDVFTVTPTVIFEVGVFTTALLLAGLVSWRNEYGADLESAKASGPEGLISVFELLQQKIGRDDGSETHPPLSKRIRRLESMLDKSDSSPSK